MMPSARERGFTLMELMVAMVVFALFLLILYNAIHTVARTSHAIESRAEVLDNDIAVYRLLRREFAQFQLTEIRDGKGTAASAFTGNANSVRWIAPLSVHRGGRALYGLVLSTEGGPQHSNLTLR